MSNPHNEVYRQQELDMQAMLDAPVTMVEENCKYAVIESKSGQDLEKRMNDMAKKGWRLRELKTDSVRLVAVMEIYE